MNNLLAVPVLLCLFGAGATFLAGRHPGVQRAVSVTAVAAVCVVAGVLVWLTDSAPLVLWVGDWPQPNRSTKAKSDARGFIAGSRSTR